MSSEYSVEEVRALSDGIRRIAGGALSDYDGVDADERALNKAADMLLKLAERIKADESAVPFDAMRASLVKALMAYRCTRTVDEDGEPLPLVDALSPGEGGTIQPGLEEIEYLAEYLADELPNPPAQAAQVDLQKVFDALHRSAPIPEIIRHVPGAEQLHHEAHAMVRDALAAPTAEPVAQGEVVGRVLYDRWAGQQDIHCNRLPAWQELSEQQRSEWAERATTPDTGNAEVDRAIGGLMSADPAFDDCERAAAILRRPPHPARAGGGCGEGARGDCWTPVRGAPDRLRRFQGHMQWSCRQAHRRADGEG